MTLMSGWTVYQSLSYINSTLQIVGQKTVDFRDKSLEATTVTGDINLFITDMDNAYGYMNNVKNLESLTSLNDHLQMFREDIDTLTATLDEFTTGGEPYLSAGNMTALGNQTGVVIRSASDTEGVLQGELMGKGNLSDDIKSLNGTSQALQLIISSMNDVVYMVDPACPKFGHP